MDDDWYFDDDYDDDDDDDVRNKHGSAMSTCLRPFLN